MLSENDTKKDSIPIMKLRIGKPAGEKWTYFFYFFKLASKQNVDEVPDILWLLKISCQIWLGQ